MKTYKRVSFEDRCQIKAMMKRDFSIIEIAKELGFHKSTIYREIKRNWGFPTTPSPYPGYFPVRAQLNTRDRLLSCRKKKLIQGELESFVIEKLKLGWGADQIAGRYRKEKQKSLSHQTVYNFIRARKELKKYLRFGSKPGIGRRKQKQINKEKLPSIHSRPKSADTRSRYGHWERDGMYGANRKQLLVCLERKSRFIRLEKMPNTRAEDIHKLTKKALENEKVISITNDNGTEFRKPQLSKYPVYYCDPYKPNQRGSVENIIGQLRKVIKRTTDLDSLSSENIKDLEKRFNQMPRKMLGYLTPFEVYYKKKVALVF